LQNGESHQAAADIDPSVIVRARNGDNDAFRAIVDHYGHRVHAAAWRITGNAEDARDAAQDAFVRLHGALRDGMVDNAIAGWLYRVAVNAAIDRRRAAARHPPTALDDTAEQPDSRASRPDTDAERRETAEIIRSLVAGLPEKQAEVFTLRDIEGVSVPEIGVMLGCAENTVRVHLSRARLALRAMLKKQYPYLITSGSDQS